MEMNKDVTEDIKEEKAEEAAGTESEGAEETAEEAEKEACDAAEKEGDPEQKNEEAQVDPYKDQYIRLMADFQNFKRRTEKEKSDIYAFANEKIILDLLNVIDNFERALEHAEEGDKLSEGMKMIFKQLQGVLDKAGVKEIEAQGADFDPNFHNAVMTEDTDEYESGKVTLVLQKGYILNNKVIRPSMVKVAN